MPPAASLSAAAAQASDDMALLWAADTLQTRVNLYWRASLAAVPISDSPNNKPIANWCSVLGAAAQSILPYIQSTLPTRRGENTIVGFQAVVEYVYRLCKLAAYFQTSGFITGAQATALLAAYNAHLASP